MKGLILFLMVLHSCATLAVAADETSFDSFFKSRKVVTTIYFQTNSEDLVKGDRDRLSAAVAQLRELQNDGHLIRVEGFSSPDGDRETNFHLSFFRARSVADFIEAEGLPTEVTLTGYGDLRAGSGDFDKERRVEIASYVKPVGLKVLKVNKSEELESMASPASPLDSAPELRTINSSAVDHAIKQKIAGKQWHLDPAFSSDISQVPPPEVPIIDALTVEQAIMEKIGNERPVSSDTVSQLSAGY